MTKRITAIILTLVLVLGLTAAVGASTPAPQIAPVSIATLGGCAADAFAPVPTPVPFGSTYIGNAHTYKLHYASCRYIGMMNEGNKVYFESRDEAIDAGYVPCKVCRP